MTTVPKTLAERVADLPKQQRLAAMVHGPELLCALRLTHGILIAAKAEGEFDMEDCVLGITAKNADGSVRVIAQLDGASAWADNEAVLAKINEDTDNG